MSWMRGRRYVSYLLRLWRAQGRAGTEWRASLQGVGKDKPQGFASLKELFAFLEEVTRKEERAGQLPEKESQSDDSM